MKIDEATLGIIDELDIVGNEVRITRQLDRPTYERVNKVLEAIGGKWNRKAKAHVFSEDAAALIDRVATTGSVELPKNEFEFFPTPRHVVNILLDRANFPEPDDVDPKFSFLEPSAGRGAIAHVVRDLYPNADISCCELMPANRNYLEMNKFRLVGNDFLKFSGQKFDRIVMNPPFSRQQDIDHDTHAHSLLKPGGCLVSVMGNGITFRKTKKTDEFKKLLYSNAGEIEELPEGSFKESGTMVNTVIVRMHNLS